MKTPCAHILLCAIVLTAGCGQKQDTETPNPTPQAAPSDVRLPPPVSSMLPPASPLDGDASEVLVRVGDLSLTRGDARMEVQMRMQNLLPRLPPEQVANAQRQTFSAVINQFIMRALFVAEADRLGITASPAEEAAAYEEIQKELPPGLDVESVIKNSPRGEKAMRDEVITGIRVRKLLATLPPQDDSVTDEDIDTYIASHTAELALPESVRARHILIATAPGASDEEKAAKRKQADSIRQQLVDGADFTKLAAEHSDCPSKERGGDLGRFARDKMVKPFSDAAFSQKVGEIGPIVETQFGYHVIRVDEHAEPGVPRSDVVDLLKRERQQKTVSTYVNKLREKADIQFGPALAPAQGQPAMPAPASP